MKISLNRIFLTSFLFIGSTPVYEFLSANEQNEQINTDLAIENSAEGRFEELIDTKRESQEYRKRNQRFEENPPSEEEKRKVKSSNLDDFLGNNPQKGNAPHEKVTLKEKQFE